MNNPLVQPDPGLYIWTIVTFLVLMALLAKYAWGPLLAALEQRRAAISTALDDARQAKLELEQLHVESARIMTEARSEAATIMARTREDANRLRDELKQKAQAEAAGVVKNAQRQIEMETARAIQQIRAEAIDFSVEIASKILQRNVSKEDNARLIEDTFRQIEATQRPS